jgi:hypothetical protein
VFALQFVIAVIFITALKDNNNEMVTFSAGAAVMTMVLMLVIWLMSVISNKDIK